MGAEVAITLLEHTASDLRQLARHNKGRVACRILAIAHIMDGASQSEAAQLCGMERQTLRDWVHRYNAQGIAGLSSRTGPGWPCALSTEQMAQLKALVVAGPDPPKHGVVRWRCADLRGVIQEQFEVAVHERTVGKLLRRLHLPALPRQQRRPRSAA